MADALNGSIDGESGAALWSSLSKLSNEEETLSYVQIQFAIDDSAMADSIVDALLNDHLVACSQRTGPVLTRYWWKGSLEQADEWIVLLKTRADLAARVVDAILERHPYETPEVIILSIAAAAPNYLAWIDSVTCSE